MDNFYRNQRSEYEFHKRRIELLARESRNSALRWIIFSILICICGIVLQALFKNYWLMSLNLAIIIFNVYNLKKVLQI